MLVIKRGRITFYVKEDSVIVGNGDFQHTSYNTYNATKKSHFTEFRDSILNSKPTDFHSVADVVGLSSRCGIYGAFASKPNLEGVEYEQRP